MRKILKIIFIILLLPIGYVLGGMNPWPNLIFNTPVQITKDIKLPEDSPFYQNNQFHQQFSGEIKAGSKCIQTLRKLNVVYLTCGMTIKGNAIKYEEKN